MSSEIKKCKDCLEELSIREVLIIKIKCWKCKKDMLAAGLLI